VLQVSDPLVNEVALFLAECLLALPQPLGFGCIPAFNNTHHRTSPDPEACRITVKLLGGDQQVVGGSLIHIIFSFNTTDVRCAGAGGNFDGLVHVTPSNDLVLLDVHVSAVQSCTDVGATNNRDEHKDRHGGFGRKADISATESENWFTPAYPAFWILFAACLTLIGFAIARRITKADPQLSSSLVLP